MLRILAALAMLALASPIHAQFFLGRPGDIPEATFAELGSGDCPANPGQTCQVTDSTSCTSQVALGPTDEPALCRYRLLGDGTPGWGAVGVGVGGTDDQIATEVPYTPTTPGDWVDPDPSEVGGALDALAATGGGGTDDQIATEVPYTPTTPGDWTDPDPADVGEALDDARSDLGAHESDTANPHTVTAAQAGAQPADADLDDLADGTLTHSKVGGATASRCARFDASGNLAVATADCPDGDTGGGGPDSVGTAELDDAADVPGSGDYVRVDTVDQAGFEYRTPAEVLADLGAESETHATEHQNGGADAIDVSGLTGADEDDLSDDPASALQDVAYPIALADGQLLVRDQSVDGRWENVAPHAGTDVTADLEEETHATEHESGGGDAVGHDNLTGFVANEHLDWTADQGATNILQSNVPAADAADALSSNPANCAAGSLAAGIAADGTAESCLDPILETELDTLAKLSTQIGTTGTADGTTFLRGDNTWATPAGSGDVVGPASSTDNGIARFDGTTGKLLQDGSGCTLDDNGQMDCPADATAGGQLTLKEGADDGTDTWALKVQDAGLTSSVTCTIGADGQIPDSCVGDGVDGGGGAPTDAEYLVSAADATLSAERVFQNGTNTTFATGVGTAQVDVADASTTVKGVVELATDGEATAGLAVQGDDSRLSDARTPTAHALDPASGFHTGSLPLADVSGHDGAAHDGLDITADQLDESTGIYRASTAGEITSQLAACEAAGGGLLLIDAGTYDFSTTPVATTGACDLEGVGGSARLLFDQTPGAGFVSFTWASDLDQASLRNIEIGHYRTGAGHPGDANTVALDVKGNATAFATDISAVGVWLDGDVGDAGAIEAFGGDAGTSATCKTATVASITGATQANPVVITATAHGFANGQTIAINDVGGMDEINRRFFTVANAAADTFELQGEDGLAHTAYTSGGLAVRQCAGTGIRIRGAVASSWKDMNVVNFARGWEIPDASALGEDVTVTTMRLKAGRTRANNVNIYFADDSNAGDAFDLVGQDTMTIEGMVIEGAATRGIQCAYDKSGGHGVIRTYGAHFEQVAANSVTVEVDNCIFQDFGSRWLTASVDHHLKVLPSILHHGLFGSQITVAAVSDVLMDAPNGWVDARTVNSFGTQAQPVTVTGNHVKRVQIGGKRFFENDCSAVPIGARKGDLCFENASPEAWVYDGSAMQELEVAHADTAAGIDFDGDGTLNIVETTANVLLDIDVNDDGTPEVSHTATATSMKNRSLADPADPTSGNHVGDRDYNDGRYSRTDPDGDATDEFQTCVTGGVFTMMLQDTDTGDGNVWSECGVDDGTWSCGTDSDGVCDGSNGDD